MCNKNLDIKNFLQQKKKNQQTNKQQQKKHLKINQKELILISNVKYANLL